ALVGGTGGRHWWVALVGTGGWHCWAQVGTSGHRWVHCWAQVGGVSGRTAGQRWAELAGGTAGHRSSGH
ncbi:unnamed protein product, partial [Staurois parvus]